MSRFTLAIVATLVAGCATQQVSHHHLRVLHTTDVHGRFAGGLTAVASYVDGARDETNAVLLLDSGDMWSGTLMSDRTEGSLGIAAYNAMGYDAVALGNHEFDYGPVGPDRTGGEDPFSALKARLQEARFPVLSANLVDKATGELPDWPNLSKSTLIHRGGIAIGVIGATTEETPSITFPHVGAALAFTDAAEAVSAEATALRQQGAEVIIVVAHIGAICGSSETPSDLSSCETDSELLALARALPVGLVDMILGGHTHRPMSHRVNGIVVAHTGANATHVMDLKISGAKGSLTVHWAPPTEVPKESAVTGAARSALDAVLGPAIAAQAEQRDERLGAKVVAPMTRDRQASSQIGSFLCDVLLTLHPDREICLLNSGGIRQDLPAGDITYGALYDILPFGNYAATLDLSGAALLELLKLGTSGAHGVLQVGGLTMTYDPNIVGCGGDDRDGDGVLGPADRDRLVSALGPEGQAIDPARTYRLITNSFLAAGGDNWRAVVSGLPSDSVRVMDHLLPIREQIAAWLRDRRPILNSPDRPVMPKPRVSPVRAKPTATGGRCVP